MREKKGSRYSQRYLVVGGVEGVDKGVYLYRPEEHELEKVRDGDIRAELADAALGQECVA